MRNNRFPGVILEPSGWSRAIPNVREFWCLPEMNVHETDLEDDRQLLALMIAGEERGFVTLYRKYQALVYRFALHTGGVRHIAEEVTQETFLALMRAPHKYQGERGPLLLYLLGIARNLVWKSTRRDRLYAALDEDRELPALLPDLAGDLAREQQVMRVRHAISSLPRKYREVIVLCSLQELSYEHAATVIGSSIGTVRSRMHRAKRLLLRKLTEGGPYETTARESSFLKCRRGIDYDM
jgi:RNA polymerase sigma-70 factor (ECF subfamily)